MRSFSLTKILMDIIMSSPLFLFCSMMGIAVLILYLINIKKDKKENKLVFIFIWIALLIILMIRYNVIVLNLIDRLFDEVFNALYFPSLAIYFLIISVSNFSFFYSIFSKKINKTVKFINFIQVLIINIFLILIVDIISKNNINIYDGVSIYAHSNLLVLLELTTSIFVSWILILLLASAHRKLKKYDVEEKAKLPEIVFEEI